MDKGMHFYRMIRIVDKFTFQNIAGKLFFFGFMLALASCASLKGGKNKEQIVRVSTELGNIDLLLYDKTPLHKANFLKLAKEGTLNGTTFHRVIKGFMIQGGDPNSKDKDPANDGNGGPGYTVPAEIVSGLSHNQGALAAARMGDDVNPKKESSGSQFYIVEGKDGAHFLDNNYTVFGQTLKGIDVVERIAEQRKSPSDRPLKDVTMQVSIIKMSKGDITKTYGYQFEQTSK
jgi:cyclophilin family peptidyl-prolyl cis-trans isomerase